MALPSPPRTFLSGDCVEDRESTERILSTSVTAAGSVRTGLRSPLDMSALLGRLGVRLRERRATSEIGPEGSYALVGGVPTITLYRDWLTPTWSLRERFTVAHEIGHHRLLLREGIPTRLYPPEALRERWCDRFAAALLISTEDVLSTAPVEGADASPLSLLDWVRALSARTGSSEAVAAKRLLPMIGPSATACLRVRRRQIGTTTPRLHSADLGVAWAATNGIQIESFRRLALRIGSESIGEWTGIRFGLEVGVRRSGDSTRVAVLPR